MKSPEWNVEKFEAQLQKEVEHRKAFQRRALPKAIGDFLLFDQFILTGLPPKASHGQSPELLFAYPPFQVPGIPLDQIVDYCFPTGPRRRHLHKHKGQFLQDAFIFRLNSLVCPVYGVCVHVNPKSESVLPFYADKTTKKKAFCFCLLTSTPVFNTHFSFLTYLALWTVNKIKEPQTFEDVISVEMIGGIEIPGLDLVHQSGHHPALSVPLQFENEVTNYYTSPLSSTPLRYSDDLELRFPPIELVENELTIMRTTLDTLFSILSPADILTVLGGLYLDAQVLVLGKSLLEVSFCVHAFLCLLKPFVFQGQVIPILPCTPDYLELLNSPTPFIIGCAPDPSLNDISLLDSCIIVDLDKRCVPPVSYYPRFPSFDTVVAELNTLLALKVNTEDPQTPNFLRKYQSYKYNFPAAMNDKILNCVQAPFNHVITDFLHCFFVTDMSASDSGVTVFNQELFIAQAPEGETAFFEMLMDSQTFREYVEERIARFMHEKGEVPDRKRRSSFKTAPGRRMRVRARTKSIFVPTGKNPQVVVGVERPRIEAPADSV